MKAVDTGREPVTLSAMEQFVDDDLRIYQDPFASRMLTSGMRFFIGFCRFSWFRNRIVSSSEKAMPGAYAETLCRKLFIDQKLQQSMDEIGLGIEIGAGYDSRSIRFSLPFIEMDFPQTMTDKEKMVEKIDSALLDRITMIGIDFDHESIPQNILSGTEKPPFFIMEGVTPYLTDEGIDSIFSFLSKAPKGSYLVFTYIQKNFLDGKDLMQWNAVYNKYVKHGVWKFGLTQESVPGFLNRYGWELLEDVATNDVVSKDLLDKRGLKSTNVERFVFAGKCK